MYSDKACRVQASGKRSSLFNRPISSPASFKDVSRADGTALDSLVATSPRASQNGRQASLATLVSIPEAAA